MALNDSGVDTSNDSNDNSVMPCLLKLPSDFESVEQQLGTYPESTSQNIFKMRLKNRVKARMKRSNALIHLNERKLRRAASTCNVELLVGLLESGVNPDCFDQHKRSPLHLSACRGYVDIVAQLLIHGANPNIVDSLGNTPLHLAVISASSNNFNSVVKLLLQAGASVHMLDRSGKNPFDLAKSKLRLMRSRYLNPSLETLKILEDMLFLCTIILRQFCKQKDNIDELDALEKRLQNLKTDDQIATEADTLLASVERLSISK